jgi:hypothetical protein
VNDEIDRLAAELAALRSADDILTFRAKLDKPTAQAVIRRLSPLDRAAVVLCVGFADRNRWAPFNATIVDGLDADAIWAEGTEQVVERPIPSAQPWNQSSGQLTSRNKRRTATRRTR